MGINPKYRNGLDYPMVRFQEKDYNLNLLNRDQLLDLQLKVEAEKNKIEATIQTAAMRRNTTGVAANPEWFNRVQAAKKLMGLLLQAIQRELGQRPKQVNRELAEFFMDAAKFHLKGETFEMLLKDAQDRRENARETALARG